MPSVLAHAWFKPKLEILLAEAEKEGYARDVSQAAITDLVNGALAAAAPPLVPDDDWARDIGEPAELAHEMPTKDALPPETGTNDPRQDMPPGPYGRVTI
jgi:hypothetical protein